GVESEELEQARAYRSGVFPISFAQVMAVGSGLGDIQIHGHPDDHFDRLRQDILDVTLDEINAAANTRLRPEDLVTVVVGDASACADSIRELGLGEVTIRHENQ